MQTLKLFQSITFSLLDNLKANIYTMEGYELGGTLYKFEF